MVKSPRILFFIDGPVPNAANNVAANALRGKGATVSFRNARFADVDNGSLEPCDGVTGDLPKSYEDAIPKIATADEAVAKYQEALDAESARLQTNADKGIGADNLGSHTLPNRAQIPVAAAVQPATLPPAGSAPPAIPHASGVGSAPPPPAPPAPVAPGGTQFAPPAPVTQQ